MKQEKQFTLVLVWSFLIFLCGLLIFTKGFLLSRSVVDRYATCNISQPLQSERNNYWTKQCDYGLKSNFKKVVLIIIDGLRFDFIDYDYSIKDNDALAFENKFNKTWRLLEKYPRNGRIFKVVADPPTTTLQRIKGFTTGSLPTFIDAGDNFGGVRILEDNIILQMLKHRRKTVFVGDDVWYELFPEEFDRAYPYPSQDVMDYDTVDYAIEKHLIPEIKEGNWDSLVVHYLGVDHCGHRHGPYHPEMARKLRQMDDDVSAMMETIDNDTILFVLGDHGMTSSGDHGGDSESETLSGMLIYTKKEIFRSMPTVLMQYQIDLVPTISMLLNLPIPFSNLGIAIPSIFRISDHLLNDTDNAFIKETQSTWNHAKALHFNAKQVVSYIKAYLAVSTDIDEEQLSKALSSYEEIEAKYEMLGKEIAQLNEKTTDELSLIAAGGRHLISEYEQILYVIRNICSEKWAKFDIKAMACGIFIMCCTTIISFLIGLFSVPNMDIQKSHVIYGFLLIFMGVLLLTGLFFNHGTSIMISTFCYGCSLILLGRSSLSITTSIPAINWQNVLSINHFFNFIQDNSLLFSSSMIFFVYLVSLFGNSYVINEGSMIAFFFTSIELMVITNAILIKTNKQNYKVKQNTSTQTNSNSQTHMFYKIISLIVFITMIVTLKTYFKCREEQKECLHWTGKVAASQKDLKSTQILLFSLSLLSCLFGYTKFLKFNGHLAHWNPSSFWIYALFPLSFILILLHWILEISVDKLITIVIEFAIVGEVIIPNMVYLLCIITIATIIWKPVNAYIFQHSSKKIELNSQDNELEKVQSIYRYLSRNWPQADTPGKGPPMVYGLGYCYTAAFVTLETCLITAFCMILGALQAPSLVFFVISTVVFLLTFKDCKSFFGVLILWSMLSSFGFFATGHQGAISAIPFDAAFVGTKGNSHKLFLMRGLLVMFNAFCSQILLAFSVPLLFVWLSVTHDPKTDETVLLDKDKKKKGHNLEREIDLIHDESTTFHNCFKMILMFGVLSMLKVLATIFSTSLHRRHLMVWKIFAPRFIFEALSFPIVAVTLLFSYLFFVRVTNLLKTWIQNIDSK